MPAGRARTHFVTIRLNHNEAVALQTVTRKLMELHPTVMGQADALRLLITLTAAKDAA